MTADWVIVELTDECDEYEGKSCVGSAYGPYKQSDAREVLQKLKASGGRCPHAIQLCKWENPK